MGTNAAGFQSLLRDIVRPAAGKVKACATDPGEKGAAECDDDDWSEDGEGKANPEKAEEQRGGDGKQKNRDGEREEEENGNQREAGLCHRKRLMQTVSDRLWFHHCEAPTKSSGRSAAKSLATEYAFCRAAGGTTRST